jgi:MazG family protein
LSQADPSERAGRALAELDRITRRLRVECPWDREQDERSIVPHTVEEAYELADAAAAGDDQKLLDELGDVLFQVHFLALLLDERGAGDLGVVADGMRAKLIRRHPHVFGEVEAADAGAVLANWDRIKREQEGRAAEDPFEDVPENLPGPTYARKLLRRAASAGLAGPASEPAAAFDDAEVALERAAEAAASGADGRPGTASAERERLAAALGEALLRIVDAGRLLGVDPELELRRAAQRMRAAAGD